MGTGWEETAAPSLQTVVFLCKVVQPSMTGGGRSLFSLPFGEKYLGLSWGWAEVPAPLVFIFPADVSLDSTTAK